jgi:hypothetical protein
MGKTKASNFLPIAARLLALALSAVVFVGCSPEAPQNEAARSDRAAQPAGPATPSNPVVTPNRLPVIRSATIQPDPVLPGEPLSVRVEAEDPDGDPVSFHHQWLVNDQPLEGARQPTLSPDRVKRGDQVAVEIIPLDGQAEGPPFRTAAVTIPNSLPEVTHLDLEPAEPRAGDRVTARVQGRDAEQDFIRYTFRWLRNNQVVQVVSESTGQEATLETGGFARGDAIVLEVTPHDSIGHGRPLRSPPLTIKNSHPTIISVPSAPAEGSRYVYDVKATDPEGDPLSYSLEAAPPGMTIGKTTGRIEWQVPVGTRGTHRVRVSVRDNQDGSAYQEFDLSLTAPPS